MKNLQNSLLINKYLVNKTFLGWILFFIFFILLFFQNNFAQGDKLRLPATETNSHFNFPLSQCWSYPTEKHTQNTIASDNDFGVYIASYNSELRAINFNGQTEWKTELGGQLVSNLLVIGNNIYIVSKSNNNESIKIDENLSNSSNTIRSVDRLTGVTNWLMKIFNSEKIHLLGFNDSVIIFGQEGIIQSIKMSNGHIVWEDSLNSELSSTPFLEDKQTVLLGTRGGDITRWSLSAGRNIQKMKVSAAPTAVLKGRYNRNLFWGDNKGSVFSVKNTNSKGLMKNYKINWRFRNGASISHLTAAPDGLLISSYDNFIYFVSYEDGEIIWKRRFSGRIHSEPFIDGGYAVITTTADSESSIIEMSSGKTINKISLENGNIFTNGPLKLGNQLLFPTLDGIFSFSTGICPDR
jgi:outer membrane protein assembly factor BamB